MTKRIGKVLLVIVVSSVFTACHAPKKSLEAIPNDPAYAPVYVRSPVVSPTPTGSIYRDGYAVDLYQRRAHRVGDILTVRLNESTSASKSSNTAFSKTNDSSVTDQTVAGNGFLGTGIELNGSVSSSVDFNGEADADISNQLNGSITVSVAGVLPNGVLEVRGEKWLQLSRGNEFIRISGLVRKEDITPDNMIDSTRIADVRIAYSETGELANASKAGWLSRFFVSDVWPF